MKTRTKLDIVHHLINKSNKIKYYCHFILFVVIIVALLLCSCQKRSQITIHVGKSERYTFGDLKVVGGNYQDVLDRCQERLQQVETNSVEEADIYNAMGRIYAEYLSDQNKALAYLNKAIEIHQNKEDEIGLARDYIGMSLIYIYIGGDVKIGLDYLEKAELLYITNNFEDFGLAGILINKGHLYIKNAQYEEALVELFNAQKIYDKRQENNITIYLLTGQAYLEMLEYELSETQYLKALQISQSRNDNYNIARIKSQLGWLYGSMENHEKSVECYNQSLDIALSSSVFLLNTASTYNNLAYGYDKLVDVDKAFECSIKSCQITEKETLVTSKTIEKKQLYKNNLSGYWYDRYNITSQAEFDNWYQEIVIEEKDWRDSDMEKKRMSEN